MNTLAPLFTMFSLSLLAACSEARPQPPPPAPAATPVRVVGVEKSVLPRAVHAIGRVAQERSVTLSFKNGGTVRALFVDEGATVRRGQRLALLDATEIDAAVAQARALVEKADRDLARAERLHAATAATQNDADNARTAADSAHATLTAALYNRSAAVLVAPEDGRIEKRLAETGEQVGPGRPIFLLSGAAGAVVVRVGVVDRDLVRIKVGDPADVHVDALGDLALPAVVSEIATVASPPAGTYEIELRLATKTKTAPVAGMTAKVDIRVAAGAPMHVVPLGALIDVHGTQAALYAIAPMPPDLDGPGAPLDPTALTVRRVPIEVAWVSGDQVAVRHGLAGDERIVSEGASFVQPGRRVRPIVETAANDVASTGAPHGNR